MAQGNILRFHCKRRNEQQSQHIQTCADVTLEQTLAQGINPKRHFSTKKINWCRILGSYGSDHEEYSILGCNTMQFGDNIMFRRNIWPQFSELKSKPNKKPAEAGHKRSAGSTCCLFSLFSDPENKGDMFLLKVRISLTYTE
jgi:hypothetical protein